MGCAERERLERRLERYEDAVRDASYRLAGLAGRIGGCRDAEKYTKAPIPDEHWAGLIARIEEMRTQLAELR